MKLVPMRVSASPTATLFGVELVIVGGSGRITKSESLSALPAGTVTWIGPVVEPSAMIAVI